MTWTRVIPLEGLAEMTVVIGMSTGVVDVLQAYKSAIPIDFIAKVLAVDPKEIREELSELERRGVVTLSGGSVTLRSFKRCRCTAEMSTQ